MCSKKAIGLLMVVAVFCSTASWAMDARKDVLGTGQGILGENSPAGLVLDSADMFVNPAYVLEYSNMIGMEGTVGAAPDYLFTGFGTVELQKLGLPGVLGIQVGRSYGMLKTATIGQAANINDLNGIIAALPGVVPALHINDFIGTISLTNLNNVRSYGLMYGLALKKNLQVGAAVNFIGNSIKGNATPGVPTTPELSKSIGDMEIRLGGTMELTSTLSGGLDLGLNFANLNFAYNDSTNATPNQKADFNGFNLDLNLRLAYAMSKSMDAVFLAGYANYGGDTKIDPNTATAGNEVTLTQGSSDIMLGVGGMMHDQAGLAGIVLGFMSQAYAQDIKATAGSTKTDPTLMYFPTLKLLVERNIASWFTFRGSIAYANWGTSTNISVGGGTDYTVNDKANSKVVTALGGTLNFGSFFVDSVIAKALLFDGPFIIGGVVNTSLNTELSIGYKF